VQEAARRWKVKDEVRLKQERQRRREQREAEERNRQEELEKKQKIQSDALNYHKTGRSQIKKKRASSTITNSTKKLPNPRNQSAQKKSTQ